MSLQIPLQKQEQDQEHRAVTLRDGGAKPDDSSEECRGDAGGGPAGVFPRGSQPPGQRAGPREGGQRYRE